MIEIADYEIALRDIFASFFEKFEHEGREKEIPRWFVGFMDHPLNKKMGDSIQNPLTAHILPPQTTVQLQRFPDQIIIANIHGGLLVVLDIDSDIPIVYFLGLVP